MKRARLTFALTAGLFTGPALCAWHNGAVVYAQAEKGPPPGGGPPPDRAERPRETRQERPDDRRGRMTEDERRGLQRDLDTASRDFYGGRPKK